MIDYTSIVRVRRDGPRGWHWIARAKYDPALHGPDLDAPFEEMTVDLEPEVAAEDSGTDGPVADDPAPPRPRRGRPPKARD